jgi:hypothetical protein
MTDCFLCEPDCNLIYARSESSVALCGLGPILPGYSVVTTARHVASCSDAAGQDPTFIEFVENVRTMLVGRYGSCLITEHGRLGLCSSTDSLDQHCLHARFLLFPGAPGIGAKASAYFARVERKDTLAAGLDCARDVSEYFLVSENLESCLILTRPGNLIRQFARLLVAEAIGRPEAANWMRLPNRQLAQDYAAELRLEIGRNGDGRQ